MLTKNRLPPALPISEKLISESHILLFCASLDNETQGSKLIQSTSDQGNSLEGPSITLMESSLQEVWDAAAGNPFVPTIGKDSQFLVGISLLLFGTLLTAFFGLSECEQS